VRAWSIDVAQDDREAELTFLQNEVYRGAIDLPIKRIDAYNRFSARV